MNPPPQHQTQPKPDHLQNVLTTHFTGRLSSIHNLMQQLKGHLQIPVMQCPLCGARYQAGHPANGHVRSQAPATPKPAKAPRVEVAIEAQPMLDPKVAAEIAQLYPHLRIPAATQFLSADEREKADEIAGMS